MCVVQFPSGSLCEFKRSPKPFAPSLLWSWTTPTVLPDYDQGISAALVADMDTDGTPDVVIGTTSAAFLTTYDQAQGYVRLLDGATGAEKWDGSVDAYKDENLIEASTVMVLADLTGDGDIEIVARGWSGELLAFEPTGSLLWRSTRQDGTSYTYPISHSSMSVADMDGDGSAEIVVGGVVLNASGVVVSGEGREASGGLGYNGAGSPYGTSSIVADVDGDGAQDVVAGNAAWRLDGTEIWSRGDVGDGFPAIADFEADGVPELVVSSTASSLRVMDATQGSTLGEVALGGDNPGPPVLADFDGDGTLEIGVQRDKPCAYDVYEFDVNVGLTLKWTTQLSVCSGFFAATAFDFNGDGTVEVVTHDDCYVTILDGTVGTNLLQIAASHDTWSEFVSIADVNGDSSAELIFPANDGWFLSHNPGHCAYTGTDTWRHGYFVYHDSEGGWMPTRRIWNQQPYHISNIRVDGTLPAPEPVSWGPGGYNDYRVSAQGKGAHNAPDLVVSLEASLSLCPASVLLKAHVQNQGSAGVAPGIAVSFYEGTHPNGTYLGGASTTQPLLPGALETVDFTVTPAPPASTPYYVVVDADENGDGSVNECVEDNNVASVSAVTCSKVY
jgi:hypothetical protein